MCRFLAKSAAAILLLAAGAFGRDDGARIIPPDDPVMAYSGYVRTELVPVPGAPGGRVRRFDRILEEKGKGYRWDNPGARITFRCDAAKADALLYYNSLHISTTARNPVGLFAVDGRLQAGQPFRTKAGGIRRPPEWVSVPLVAPGSPAGFHTYDIFLPYGDSVDFAGLRVNAGAAFERTSGPRRIRYLAYGDSVTQGFNATDIGRTYPFLVGWEKGWETINLGLGGRASTPSDGEVIASLRPDVVSILMGVNDWQGGVPLARYRANMTGLIERIRSRLPGTPLYLLTSLWVKPSWQPKHQTASLEAYRQILRDIAKSRPDPNLHLIEGPALIDPKAALFDRIAVHPNDAGFAMMAARLEPKISYELLRK